MPKSAIYDTKTLDAEIKRLKKRANDLEDSFNECADQFKDNYGKMAFNSILGNSIRTIPLLGAIVYPLLSKPAVQDSIQQFSETIIRRASSILQKWFSAIFDR